MFGVVKYLQVDGLRYSIAAAIRTHSYAKKSSSQLNRVSPFASIGSGITLIKLREKGEGVEWGEAEWRREEREREGRVTSA